MCEQAGLALGKEDVGTPPCEKCCEDNVLETVVHVVRTSIEGPPNPKRRKADPRLLFQHVTLNTLMWNSAVAPSGG